MAGGERGCRLVQNEGLQGELLEVMVDFVSGGEDLKRVEDGQPFRLGLIKALLEEAGDGDCAFLQEAVEGFPLGVKHPLPRTPAAFEKQVEWALSYDPSEGCDLTRSNYPSAAEHEDHLRSHLEEEVAEGLVAKMTEREFEEMYGQDRAISALAVLVEDEVSGKKRVIHDASHGVKVNHRIKCRDKLRMPGGREKRCLLEKFQRSKDVVFSLIGDFGKAHRRFKYRRDECGFLACRVSDNDPYIYVNCVGTFGVSSTPYWWGGSLEHYSGWSTSCWDRACPWRCCCMRMTLKGWGSTKREGRAWWWPSFSWRYLEPPSSGRNKEEAYALSGLAWRQTTGSTRWACRRRGLAGWWRGWERHARARW